jgi:hypothetical protein
MRGVTGAMGWHAAEDLSAVHHFLLASMGWHGVEDLAKDDRLEVIVFVLGTVGLAALLAFVSQITDRGKGP